MIFSVSLIRLWTLYVVPYLSLIGCGILGPLPAARAYPGDQDTPRREMLVQLERNTQPNPFSASGPANLDM